MYKLSQNSIIRADGVCIPLDPANVDYAAYLKWIEEGNVPEPIAAPTTDDLIAANTVAIQAKLDATALEYGYDNIVSACSYSGTDADPNDPLQLKFQREGNAFKAWRAATWAKAITTEEQIISGTIPMPTPDEAVAAMPALALP